MDNQTFDSTEIEFIHRDNQVWVRGTQIGTALGYTNPRVKIREIYQRYSDEFTESMTTLIKLPDLRTQTGDAGQMREVRVFSLRGTHLIAMFARTEKAKSFRRWVLDLIDDFLDGTENAKLRYIKAEKELQDAKQQASTCGAGLSRWKHSKPVLEQKAEQTQHQFEMMLHTRV